MDTNNIQELQKKYMDYNHAYSQVISWWESILRGVMQYKKQSEDIYINTTLFSWEKIIKKWLVIEKQKEIQKNIVSLEKILFALRNDKDFFSTWIARFLERNIDKTIGVFFLISHATLWIEANKWWLYVHKKHLRTCHEMTLLYNKNTLWKTLHSQPIQKRNIEKYLLSLYTSRSVEGEGIFKNRLKREWILKEEHESLLDVVNEAKLSVDESLSILLVCIETMLRIHKDPRHIVLFLEKKFLLTEHANFSRLLDTLHIRYVFEKKEIWNDCFCIQVGSSWWRISKNILYVPIWWLDISLLTLCEIIDHELGTHAATNLADTALLNRRSHWYSKMEEWMAVLNQRMVSCVSLWKLKRTPTFHHVACYFAECMGFDELKDILYDFFLLLWNTKRLANKNAQLTALRAKRYVLFSLPWANSHLLAYTDGYLYFLDMFAKSQKTEDNSFRLLRKRMHLWKFTSKDLNDIKPFLRNIKSDVYDIAKPIYFWRCIYHSLVLSRSIEEIIEKDARYNRTGTLDQFEKKCLEKLCKDVGSIISSKHHQ